MLTINNVLINRIESQSLYEKLSTLPTIGDRPENIGGTDVYCGMFADADRKTLTDAAEGFKSKGGVAAFVSVSDTVSVILADRKSVV